MRAIIIALILVAAGAILFMNGALNNRTVDSAGLAEVKTNCLKCHNAPPTYPDVTFVHNRHAALKCVTCHAQAYDLAGVETGWRILPWVGGGALAIAMIVILVNVIVIKTRKDESIKGRNG